MKFYKILKSANLEKSKIMLPGKFVRRYWADAVPENVTLKVPNGAKWIVGVRNFDDGVWFAGKRWAAFAASLGLQEGDLLLFDYDDANDAVFHVVVMDMSASEIKYPALVKIDDEDDENGVWEPVSVNRKLEYAEDDDSDVVVVKDDEPDIEVIRDQAVRLKTGYAVCRGETILDSEGRIRCVVKGRRIYSNSDQSEQAFARARALKADAPIFIVALQSAYVTGPKSVCQLVVPKSFFDAYFNLAIKDVFLTTDQRGKTWSVTYSELHGRSWFTTGWRQFAEDNGLATGDVCVFELIRGVQNALKVIIFRAKQENEGDEDVVVLTKDDAQGNNKKSNRAKSSYGDSLGKFVQGTKASDKLEPDVEVISRNPSGNWTEGLRTDNDQEDNWNQGYAMIRRETIRNSQGKIQCVIQGRRVNGTTDHAEHAFSRAKARAFKADGPTFIIAMQPTYVTGLKSGRHLLVPQSFIKAYFDSDVNDLVLKTHGGRAWSVKYRNGNGMTHFGLGWGQFSEDNGLSADDVCVFELIKGAENALKVAIFRATHEVED